MEKEIQQDPIIMTPAGTLVTDVPISVWTARQRHICYLENGPFVLISNDNGDLEVLHSLHINKKDLELLNEFAEDGIRLHLCKEPSGHLNIIAVAVAKDGELNISLEQQPGKVQPIVNTLEPCPSLCSVDFSNKSLNCWTTEEYGDCWVNPNEPQDGRIWYYKGDDGQRVYIDQPADAPHYS